MSKPVMFADKNYRQAIDSLHKEMVKGGKQGLIPMVDKKYTVPLYVAFECVVCGDNPTFDPGDVCASCASKGGIRINGSDINILKQLERLLPTTGMAGWVFGVDTIQRILKQVED